MSVQWSDDWKTSDIRNFVRSFTSFFHKIVEADADEDDKAKGLYDIERAAHELRMSLPHAEQNSTD